MKIRTKTTIKMETPSGFPMDFTFIPDTPIETVMSVLSAANGGKEKPELTNILRNQVLIAFGEVKDSMIIGARNIANLTPPYVMIPFTVNNLPSNRARWNVSTQHFDQILVDVYRGDNMDEVVTVILPIGKS